MIIWGNICYHHGAEQLLCHDFLCMTKDILNPAAALTHSPNNPGIDQAVTCLGEDGSKEAASKTVC